MPFIVAVVAAAIAAPAQAAGCVLQTIAELPVTMQDLRPMITAKINGVEARFFIDSGAFFSTLTTASAAKYGLALTAPPFGMGYIRGAGKGEAEISVANIKDFTLAGQLVHHIPFIVVDRGGGSGEVGTIGQNVLAGFDVEYDLADGVVRLMLPKDCGYAPLAYWATNVDYSEIGIDPIDVRNPHTRGEASVNGERIRVMFDTGSPQSLLSTAAAAHAGVKSSGPGVVQSYVTSGIAQRSYFQTWRGTFASFKLGGEEIKNTPLMFGDFAMQDETDMLIGADFFLSHRILVSNSQHRMYFTYNGGPVFNLDRRLSIERTQTPTPDAGVGVGAAPTAADTSDAPRTADDFARHAAAFMATRDFPSAIAAWNQAVALAPSEPRYVFQRALAEIDNRQPLLAMIDLDQAVKLNPADIPARLARAEITFAMHEPDKAKSDVDEADRLAAAQPDQRLAVAAVYQHIGFDKEAIAEIDPWLAGHPVDDRRPTALNDRCWWSALMNVDLSQALIDCDEALKLRPGDPGFLDSRALAYLRLGEFDRALADYNAALRVRSNSAWSLYGRGLTELRKGMVKEGQADINAAAALDPRQANEAKKYGLTP